MSADASPEHLFNWVKSFHLKGPHETLSDLSDGVALASLCQQICPDIFNEFVSNIKDHVAPENWMLRVSNVKKVIQGLNDFYEETSGPSFSVTVNCVDAFAIAKQGDHNELGKLIQLILGAAVNCDQKEFYIQNIMKLDMETQMGIKNAIEGLFLRSNFFDDQIATKSIVPDVTVEVGPVDEKVTGTTSSVTTSTLENLKKQIGQLMHDFLMSLESKNDKNTHELLDLANKLQKLLNKGEISYQIYTTSPNNFSHLEDVTCCSSSSSLIESTDAVSLETVIKLQKEIETLKEDLFKMKNVKEQIRVKSELLEEELIDLKRQNEKLKDKAGQIKHLKDELDFQREISKQIQSHEATIEMYRKKMEQMNQLKRNVKLISDENNLIQAKLDEEMRLNSLLKANNQQLKEQILQLTLNLTTANHKIQSVDFEHKLLEEKVNKLNEEREELNRELDQVKRKLETSQNESQILCQINHKMASSLDTELKTDQLEGKIETIETEKAHLKDQLEYLIDKLANVLPVLNLDPVDGSIRVEKSSFNLSIASRRSRKVDSPTPDHENAYKLIDSLQKEIHYWKKKVFYLKNILEKREKQMNQMQIQFQENSIKVKQITKVLEPITLKPVPFHLVRTTP